MEKKIKKCIYCGEEFEYRMNKQVRCNKPECIRAAGRDYHNNIHVTYVPCAECGKTFKLKAYDKNTLCPECRKLHGRGPYKYKNIIQQKHVCRQCGKLLYTVEKHDTHCAEILADKTCDECKELNKQKSSNRMKLENPAYKGKVLSEEEYAQKIVLKQEEAVYRSSEARANEWRQEVSIRMKNNNPMKNPATVEKVRKSLKAKKDLEYKLKPKVMNCREAMRDYLKFWRDRELKRAGYKCEVCGKENVQLYVHHNTIKFKDIYLKSCTKLGLNSAHIAYRSEDYYRLKEEIVKYHAEHLELGQVLCKECHAKIDDHFRIKLEEYNSERDSNKESNN